MVLRTRLAFALAAAALLPMVAVVAVPLSRVESAAADETARRLATAGRQAELIVARERAETAARLDRAANGLASDRHALDAVLQGPDAAARGVARTLAERHGLDVVEILGPGGTVLSASGTAPAPGLRSPLAGLPAVGLVLVRFAAPGTGGPDAVGFLATRRVRAGGDSLTLLGGRAVGRAMLAEIAALTGEPAALFDPAGAAVLAAGGAEGTGTTEASVTIDGGWSVRVGARAASASRIRADLLTSALGVAPLAAVAAIAAGFFLAGRFVRPVASLADRADAIAAARGGPMSLLSERDEVRRLESSFDRMIEALERSERERAAAQRVAAWQQIARRVAHEVRNALAPIRIAVANLKRTRELAPNDIDVALAAEGAAILEEVESLRRLVDEFSEFARLPAPRPVSCDLAVAVRQAAALFGGRIAAAGVALTLELGMDEGVAVADPDQIGRVLKNVIANALDALEAKKPDRDRRLDVALRRTSGGRRVEIEVRDTGIGMEPGAIARAFDPYFTTRAGSGGTGLGLAIALRIVTEHGGTIRAESSPGRGASFTIVLPADGLPPTKA